ncbi:MAG: alpha/beta hydrolase [Casimicrobiaceae bacterium]
MKVLRPPALARFVFLCFVILLGLTEARAAGGIGIVLLHGKTGMPGQHAKLAAALRAAGYAVEMPKMCWSKDRIFDKPYPACIGELDSAVARLRADGATVIVVGGTSQGAVVAIDYGANHAGLAGIVAMSPAADPIDPSKYPNFAAALDQARALVKAGKGSEVTELDDLVAGGKDISVKTTPDDYLSFHDPKIPIATIRNLKAQDLPKLKVPLLWVAGTKDPAQATAAKTFQAAPENRLSRYITVDAGHAGVPDVAEEPVIAWLKSLQ